MHNARRRPQRAASPQRSDSTARLSLRRRRNRRVVRRGPPWYLLVWRGLYHVGLVVGVMATGVGTVWGSVHLWRRAVADPRLAVHAIEVTGTHRSPPAEVLAYADVPLGVSMLTLDLDAVAQRVRQDPWVRRVAVRRRFPDRVSIEVAEHRPTLLVSLGGLYLADEDGQLFKGFSSGDGLALPVVTGLDREEASRRLDVTTERVREAIGLRAALDNHAGELGELEELHWDQDLGWSVVVRSNNPGGAVRIHLGRQPLGRLPMVMATLRVCAERHQSPAVIWADGIKNPDRVIVQLHTYDQAGGTARAAGYRSADGTEG